MEIEKTPLPNFAHGLGASDFEPYLHPPGFDVPHGSTPVFQALDQEDQCFAPYLTPKRTDITTMALAIQRVRKDLQAHCDPEARRLDEVGCRGIGGRLQIATITFKDGFRWVPGFEPAWC